MCTCGTEREGVTGGEKGSAKVFAGLITLHEWYAQHRRICYAHGSLHTHTHKSRRSSFLSSSLPDLGFASVLTLHLSFSKEALGLSPAFSPAAVKPMSTHFLPFKLNILLGKVWVSDATTLFFSFFDLSSSEF